MFVFIKMREIVDSNIPMDFKIESNDFDGLKSNSSNKSFNELETLSGNFL